MLQKFVLFPVTLAVEFKSLNKSDLMKRKEHAYFKITGFTQHLAPKYKEF